MVPVASRESDSGALRWKSTPAKKRPRDESRPSVTRMTYAPLSVPRAPHAYSTKPPPASAACTNRRRNASAASAHGAPRCAAMISPSVLPTLEASPPCAAHVPSYEKTKP